MRSTVARRSLLGCSAAAIGAGVFGQITPFTGSELPPVMRAEGARPASPALLDVDSIVRLIVVRTPFRAVRKPAQVSFDPKPSTQTEGPATPKPTLVLSGIVWSADPTAVIQGLPGIEGSKVVRRGDIIGGIRINRIEQARVWATGLDTSWTLVVREPWK